MLLPTQFVDETDELLEALTAAHEEVAWLRTLADFSLECDLTVGLTVLTERIFASLRRIIDADALIWTGVDGEYSDVRLHDENNGEFKAAIIDELLAEIEKECSSRSIEIQNYRNSQRLGCDSPLAAYSWIRLSLHSGDNNFGTWYCLRLHNRADADAPTSPSGKPREFGTFESSIAQAAAKTVISHAVNLKLYQAKEQLMIGIVQSLAATLDARDSYTQGHSRRVAIISKQIYRRLGYSEKLCEQIYVTGLFHDIGKIGIPDRVLLKEARLTDEEFAEIQKHPVIGHQILRPISALAFTLEGVRHHHERWDGRGYPDRLAGEAIPLAGRVLAAADSFDAMTSTRPYRQAMPLEKAVGILKSGAGTQWDSRVIDAFLDELDNVLSLLKSASKPSAVPSSP